MRKLILFLCLFIAAGCGYTTRGFSYKEDRIYIAPVINKIDITNEKRGYSRYTVYPVLIEKKLTNRLINQFSTDGHLRVAKYEQGGLALKCQVNRYLKEALNYTSSDDVREQRLRLFVNMKLYDSEGVLIREKNIVGETSFFLAGAHSQTQSSAQNDLIDDTVRRIVEAVIEEW